MTEEQLGRLLSDVQAVLDGIDAQQTDRSNGWWETSVGADFGAAKLAALKALLRERLDRPHTQR